MSPTDTASLHMVQLYLDPRRLAQLCKMLHLNLAQTDTNYLIHCALGELFGDCAPKPFYVDDDPRAVQDTVRRHPNGFVRVLGYTDVDHDDLKHEAQLSPNPTIANLYDSDRIDSHAMPSSFREGRTLEFELRACPVVRKSSAGTGTNHLGQKKSWHEGQALDAYLSAQWTSDEKLDRAAVYRDWLNRQFDLRGGADLDVDSVAMTRFSIERMTRRTHGTDRKARTFQAPDVTLTGRLTVTDSPAFVNLLASGIGRQKSFGYGMLKVRRAS